MSKPIGTVVENNTRSIMIEAAAGILAVIRPIVEKVAAEVGLSLDVSDWAAGAGGRGGRIYLVEMKERDLLGNVAKLNAAYLLLQERFVPQSGTSHGMGVR